MTVQKIPFDWIKRPDGTSEFIEYISSLSAKDKAKLLATISKTEENGIEVAKKMKWVEKLRDGIFEIRSKQGSDIQRALYFYQTENELLITHGFTKKTQKTPVNEIKHAKAMRDRYIRGAENEQNKRIN